ncbi:MAG: hypothetical protein K2W82_11845 [Candidatus Obscuribacterales bacterium]|nr:hypothetical protein [Candidatus Obscuribacterales bacterium]
MKTAKRHLIIVGFGPVAGYKYSRSIRAAMDRGDLDSYSIVDLQSQKETVLERVQGLPAQPKDIYFIPDPSNTVGSWADTSDFDAICKSIGVNYDGLKVLVSTEPKAHEAYLKYCVNNDIDSLVTKPIILPMLDGKFDPSSLLSSMSELVNQAAKGKAKHAVLCLGRYHPVYEQMMRQPIQERMNELGTPITSFHLRTSSAVWNLAEEFQSREDHPYKYGYGMLMHGGYHYVDVLCQFLLMNTSIYPNDEFSLEFTSYAAFPHDQSLRIPEKVNQRLEGYSPERSILAKNAFGETDIVSVFCLRSKTTGQVLTLGSLSLEQTTPGMRSWAPFPVVPYNINGRLHCTDVEVQLSTVFSMNCRVVKIPVDDKAGPTDLRGKNFARVIARSNALLMGTNEFYSENTIERPYGNSFSYSAETAVFDEWLAGIPTKSDLASHMTTTAVLQKLAESVHKSGQPMTLDFPFKRVESPAEAAIPCVPGISHIPTSVK